MGFRFRRTMKIAPGIRLNFSRSGVSTSVGKRGASVTVGRRGTHANVGLPGTGMSYRQRIDGLKSSPGAERASTGIWSVAKLILLTAAFLALVAALLG
jgi:hypothetical protein